MKKENNKFILGGGISGLIFSFYNPEYTIISEDIGGRLNKDFFKNIIYLHETKETEQFLKDVGIEYKKRTQLIKYSVDNKITSEITKENKISLIKKKLDDKEFEPKDLNLSTSDYYISILEFNFAELVNLLKEKTKFIQGKVIRITESEIITEDSRHPYKNIVSTIPAHVFWKIYYKKQVMDLKSKPITFVLCDKEPEHIKEGIKYDMIYFCDDNQKYTRISKKPGERDEKRILYEFTGGLTKEEVIQYLPKDANVIEYYVDYSGIIYSNFNNIAPRNVLFIGRFATWNHSGKQQDVLKESLFDFDFRNVWNRQKNFSKSFIDFNKLDDIKYKEFLTKEYFIHLQAELAEVIEEINYKQHKKYHEVDIEKVKYELMDVQKYLLNLFIVWGVDPKEFIELFDNKSTVVEKRLEKENEKVDR